MTTAEDMKFHVSSLEEIYADIENGVKPAEDGFRQGMAEMLVDGGIKKPLLLHLIRAVIQFGEQRIANLEGEA